MSQIYGNKVQTVDVEDSAVTTAKINDSAVTTAKINNSAVTTAKINNAAVTSAKLATGNAERDWVLARTAAAAAGAVGTYAFAQGNVSASFGATASGSSLRSTLIYYDQLDFFSVNNASTLAGGGTVLSGTWRCMGGSTSSKPSATLWLRIS